MSTNLLNHSVAHCFANIFKHLHRDSDFEVYALTPTESHDEWNQRIASNCKALIRLDADLVNARHQIRQLRLDALGYLDIGMATYSYLLAMTRMAPVTFVLNGHPVTTGIETIDYFISSKLYEDDPKQYTEELVELEGTMADYDKPEFDLIPREEIKEFPSGNVYTCPMTLFKVHPDMDYIIRMICERDDQANILFFKFGDSDVHYQLAKRMDKTLSKYLHRIFFRGWADRNEFMSVLAHSKAVLDTPYFGAGNTSFAAMASTTPIIAYYSPIKGSIRCANTMAHYKQLSHDTGIDYVKRYVARDPTYYAKLAVQCNEKIPADVSNRLFNRSDGIDSFKDWLRGLYEFV